MPIRSKTMSKCVLFFTSFFFFPLSCDAQMDLDSTHQYIVHQRTRTLGVLADVLAIIRW